ncbi:MAG TPA: DNA-protecting protein DprA [Candidatus Latescibacteria bacterium]|nr:DNA-protecting protein DprA [Candidatus Latescibacterota bacterium]
MEDLRSYLELLFVSGVGPVRYRALVERFGSPRAVLEASLDALLEVPGMDRPTAEAIQDYRDREAVAVQLKAVERTGAKVLSLWDPEYPPLLKEIPDPPPLLFVLGNVEALSIQGIAIVGTRAMTPYGSSVTEELARELVARGFAVVSGMARGIDGVAHRAALKEGGTTVAVVGCGVNVVYPPEHRKLRDRIIRQGAVVSEFPMGTKPEASNFPRRNRIISGMSLGTVVVEAGEQSGALITAAFALEQNREVFAVPGSVRAPKSKGTNRLIQRGAAKLIVEVEDILQELPSPKGALSLRPPPTAEEVLSCSEREVLEKLSYESKHIDVLSAEVGRTTPELLAVLLSLELKGLVRQLPGAQFVRT